MAAAVMIGFTACDDDDNDEIKDDSLTAKYELTLKVSDDYLTMSDFTICYTDFSGSYKEVAIGKDGATIEMSAKTFPASMEIQLVQTYLDTSDSNKTSLDLGVSISQKILAVQGKTETIVSGGTHEYSNSASGVKEDNAATVIETQLSQITNLMGKYELTQSGTAINSTFTSTADLYPLTSSFDALELFCDCLVTDNGDGTYERFVGAELSSLAPTVLSICVDDYDAAVKKFKSWVIDESQLTTTANGVTFKPLDENGKSQGTITLTKESGADGVVATVTFSDGATVPYTDEIRFILYSAWPGNDDKVYYKKGETLTNLFPQFEKHTVGIGWEGDKVDLSKDLVDKTYICLNDTRVGETAYFVCLHNRCCNLMCAYNYDLSVYYHMNLPSKATMQTIYNDIVKGDFGSYKKFNEWMKEKGMQLPDEEVWVADALLPDPEHYTIYGGTVDLEDGSYETYKWAQAWRNYTYMQVIKKTVWRSWAEAQEDK